MTSDAGTTRKRRPYAARLPPEERRQQLLDAALALISREGYAGVTVEAVAHEAGVTKPVIYGVYAKLPDLLIDLLARTQNEALSQLLAALGGSAQPRPAEVTRAWCAAVRGNPQTWAPILLIGAHTPEVVLERIATGRALVVKALADLLEAGAPDIPYPAQLAAEALIAAAEHFGRALVTDPDRVNDDELATLIDDLVNGVRRRRRRTTPS